MADGARSNSTLRHPGVGDTPTDITRILLDRAPSGVRVSASFQKKFQFVDRLGSGPRIVGILGLYGFLRGVISRGGISPGVI